MKRVLGTLLLLLAGSAAVYGYAATRSERLYREHIARGEAALAADDTATALAAFTDALTRKPESMLGYLKRGEAHRRRGDLEAALRDLRRASELDPTAPRVHELQGDVNYALGRFERAADRFQAYVALDDRSPRVLYKLGLAKYRNGQIGAAVGALQRAVKLDDRFAEAHYLLGLCYRDQQKTAESQAALQRSLALAPALVHAREELADLYARLGRTDDRIAQLEALLVIDPGPAREVAVGLAYASAGRQESAIRALSRAAERYAQHPQVYAALGRVWLERAQARGDRVELKKALGALEESVSSEPNSESLMLFGRALALSGDYERAQRTLEQATQKMPADPLAFYYLAQIAERRGAGDVARTARRDHQALHGDR